LTSDVVTVKGCQHGKNNSDLRSFIFSFLRSSVPEFRISVEPF
jgi:hypothetical protein